jgi:hypothetical protein
MWTNILGISLCLLFNFSPVDATEWQAFERDGLILNVAPSDSARGENLLRDLIIGRNEIQRKLGGASAVSMVVYLAPSADVFHELTQGRLPHWSAGVAFPRLRTIVLNDQVDNLHQVAQHEFAHVLLHAIVPGRVPVWFNEGVAMWASHEWRLRQSAFVLHAVFSDGLIPLSEIDNVLTFPSAKADMAYVESLLAVIFLIHLGGPNAVVVMLSELEANAPFEVALFRVTGETPREFERRWRRDVEGRFGLMTLLFSPDLIWLYLTLLLFLAYVGVRLRNRAVLRRWESEDSADDMPLKLRLGVHRREDES